MDTNHPSTTETRPLPSSKTSFEQWAKLGFKLQGNWCIQMG
ncbi:hypothetical protein [Flagellimonas oceanensis]|nr:hypothetical protein [Allomuricauda oceanensis]